ncbi:MAG: HNH endonuclease signature motif containing protein, partial [Xanthomonadales bacterium]|nr:HNH endonuclease signature motif containing protein [Xanthomonadales bacterium]
AETSRRLACDAGLIHWLDNRGESQKTETLSIGRKSRTVPLAIRRALQQRDKCCRFPGCTCSHFVDAHHIHYWADGGETNMNNLLLLCRTHHRLVHEGGFQLNKLTGGGFQFINHHGEVVPSAPKMRSSGNVFALENENTNSGIQIDHKTCIPNWLGGGMEMDIVIEGLLRRQETKSSE